MKALLPFLFLALGLFSCNNDASVNNDEASNDKAAENIQLGKHPDWSLHSSIYEVNIRQHTPEGTINAMRKKLPELQKLGVKILWVMPIQPIGLEKRKGGLGSYYSIKDYTAVNPEFGTMQDFVDFVQAAHDLGFKVILDWVANHTAWDAVWMEKHPDWYTRKNGKVVAPVDDWSDVADLNYEVPEMRRTMQEAMKFWIEKANIDGFRCDVAMMVPMDFWNETRQKLDSIKPVFMLAEAEGPEFHEEAFDMTYGWEFHHIMNEIAQGHKTVAAIDSYQVKVDTTYDKNAYLMYFTTNHDENSWNGTVYERMGNNAKNFFLLSATMPYGMPLLYSGQEYGLNKRLAFFEKDTINGNDSTLFKWYAAVVNLKMNHPALVMGREQGSFNRYANYNEPQLYAFSRIKNGEHLLVILNFSAEEKLFDRKQNRLKGTLTPVITNEKISETKEGKLRIAPHSYLLARLK